MIFDAIGRLIAHFLNKRTQGYEQFATIDLDSLQSVIEPGDILLVEGDTRFSTIIKYMTQSTWSHVCLYVGDALKDREGMPVPALIEADIIKGVQAVPVSTYIQSNLRICRPCGLTEEDRIRVVEFAISKLGYQYDLGNIFDLGRYLLPLPVPVKWRRRALDFGSGDPTKAICSSMIAEAFQRVSFPILPRYGTECASEDGLDDEAILCARNHRLFTPRDFDLSPYFETIKPTLKKGFDYKKLKWKKG